MAAADAMICPICQQVMNVGVDDLQALGCSHVFHVGCLDEYSAATGKPIGLLVCPCCKMPPTEDVAFSDVDPDARGSGSTGPVAATEAAAADLDGEELPDEDAAPDDDDEVIATDATGTARAKPRTKGAAKKAAAKPKAGAKPRAKGKPKAKSAAKAARTSGEPADADAPTANARGKAKATAAKALAKATAAKAARTSGEPADADAPTAKARGKAKATAAKALAKATAAKALAKAAAKAKGRGKAAAASNASSSSAPPEQATEPPAEETEAVAEPEPVSTLAAVAFGMVVCSSCGRPNLFSQCRVLSKGRQSWRCNGCNVKSVQLRRALGQWPTDGFNMLSLDSIDVCMLARIRNTSIVACLGVQHGKRHSRS